MRSGTSRGEDLMANELLAAASLEIRGVCS